MMSLRMGQQSYIYLILESLFFWALLKRRELLAGIALAFVSMKPHYCLFLACSALAQKRWKLIAAAATTELLLLTAAALVLGWQNVIGYPAMLMHAEQTTAFLGVEAQKMVSFRGLATVLFGTQFSLHASMFVMAIGLVCTLVLWKRAQIKGLTDLSWPIALTVLLSLVTSPHTHVYDLVLMGIVAIALPAIRGSAGALPGTFFRYILFAYPIITYLVLFLLNIYLPLPFITLFFLNTALLITGFRLFKERMDCSEQSLSSDAPSNHSG